MIYICFNSNKNNTNLQQYISYRKTSCILQIIRVQNQLPVKQSIASFFHKEPPTFKVMEIQILSELSSRKLGQAKKKLYKYVIYESRSYFSLTNIGLDMKQFVRVQQSFQRFGSVTLTQLNFTCRYRFQFLIKGSVFWTCKNKKTQSVYLVVKKHNSRMKYSKSFLKCT